LEQKRTVVTKRLTLLEAKKTSEQKEAKCLKKNKDWEEKMERQRDDEERRRGDRDVDRDKDDGHDRMDGDIDVRWPDDKCKETESHIERI
jgi:hypothetical protein